MEIIDSLFIVGLAALIHASFQLSVSVLTLLSGHAIGRKAAHSKLLRLTNSFLVGVGVMTLLVVSFIALILQHSFQGDIPLLAWATACGLLLGLGVAVWSFYYRREKGTSLWVPRSIAQYLTERSKATKRSAEAFGLGLSSVVAEMIFNLAPMLISAMILIQLSPVWQLVGLGLYTVISLLPLFIVCGLIGAGHKLSRIQKWRENNKRFLQFASGSGLLVLGVYMYVDKVITASALAPGGF